MEKLKEHKKNASNKAFFYFASLALNAIEHFGAKKEETVLIGTLQADEDEN